LEAGLATVEELSQFLALEPAVVGQALRFLTAIGHVTWSPAVGLTLTELGRRSVRDGVRYTVTREDRRKLYFDAFACRPLTRSYYDARRVEFLSGGAAQQAIQRDGGPRVHVLATTKGFRREALVELSGSPERDRFNLPARIDRLDSVDEEQVFLP